MTKVIAVGSFLLSTKLRIEMNMEKDVEPIEISDEKLAMVVAASSALDYLNKKPNAGIEEAMKHVIKTLKQRAMQGLLE